MSVCICPRPHRSGLAVFDPLCKVEGHAEQGHCTCPPGVFSATCKFPGHAARAGEEE